MRKFNFIDMEDMIKQIKFFNEMLLIVGGEGEERQVLQKMCEKRIEYYEKILIGIMRDDCMMDNGTVSDLIRELREK